MSSVLSGAPKNVAPSASNYQVPDLAAREQDINQIGSNLQAPDLSQYQDTFNEQQQYLQYLTDVAGGRRKTQAQQQSEIDLQNAKAQLQGSAQEFRGGNPALALRVTNQAQTAQSAQIQASTARLAAQQRMQAQGEAQNVLSQMTQESLSAENMQQNYEMAVAQAQEARVQGMLTLSGLQQNANLNYARDLASYQETRRQEAIKANAAHNEAIVHFIAGGALAVGAAAAFVLGTVSTPFTAGVGTAAGYAGGIALAGAAAQQFGAGAASNNEAAALEK